jgi:hypothetical protein
MRTILTQAEVDAALNKFDNKDSKSWTDKEKRKDRKALTQIQLPIKQYFDITPNWVVRWKGSISAWRVTRGAMFTLIHLNGQLGAFGGILV